MINEFKSINDRWILNQEEKKAAIFIFSHNSFYLIAEVV